MLRYRISYVAILTVLGAATFVTGCSKGSDQARAQREARAQARAGAHLATDRLAAAGAQADEMMAAVSSAPNDTRVGLRFKFTEQPRVGQPLRLELALSQAAGLEIDAMHVSLQPREGMALQSERTYDYVGPATGATQQMPVTVMPMQAGVLGLMVTVLVDSTAGSDVRSFTIPVIAIETPR
jgi:hypothetical protein